MTIECPTYLRQEHISRLTPELIKRIALSLCQLEGEYTDAIGTHHDPFVPACFPVHRFTRENGYWYPVGTENRCLLPKRLSPAEVKEALNAFRLSFKDPSACQVIGRQHTNAEFTRQPIDWDSDLRFPGTPDNYSLFDCSYWLDEPIDLIIKAGPSSTLITHLQFGSLLSWLELMESQYPYQGSIK